MTYFIGLDIAKFKHECFIMDENGEVIHSSFSFSDDHSSFCSLLNVLSSLDSSIEKRIGLEATRHYSSDLKIFLQEHNLSPVYEKALCVPYLLSFSSDNIPFFNSERNRYQYLYHRTP